MKDWQKIQSLRKDITSYVIHLVRGRLEDLRRPGEDHYRYSPPYEVLKEILGDGFFKLGFAPRLSKFKKEKNNTIKGLHPAVCFTEQPLNFILISNQVSRSRYPLYGIGLKKEHLYGFGGRPVIYGDETLLGLLHPDIHYLWVGYDPTSYESYGGYTLDWTHEREWRCRPKKDASWNIDGVPILLPYDYWYHEDNPCFKILVKAKEEASELEKWISEINYRGEDKWLTAYFNRLSKARIISFDEVEEHLKAGEENWSRLETITPE